MLVACRPRRTWLLERRDAARAAMLRVAVVWALLELAARCSGQGGGPEAWTE